MRPILIAGLLLGLIAQASIAHDPTINRLLASHCAQCHGTDGYAVGDMDSLAGESAKDLREDLRDMRREDQPENIMDHQAIGYTEEQIARIARFYASLPDDRDDLHENDFEDPEEDEEDEEDDDHDH
ncbi:MAG: hypothetical protein QNJ40_09845 [Xanthomonadales bacterium]|nr:hypothetical protein [Xanthomonadales bacterium]